MLVLSVALIRLEFLGEFCLYVTYHECSKQLQHYTLTAAIFKPRLNEIYILC